MLVLLKEECQKYDVSFDFLYKIQRIHEITAQTVKLLNISITIVAFLLKMYAADFCTCNDVSAETEFVTFSAMSIGD